VKDLMRISLLCCFLFNGLKKTLCIAVHSTIYRYWHYWQHEIYLAVFKEYLPMLHNMAYFILPI
jgi:hypothetical protein